MVNYTNLRNWKKYVLKIKNWFFGFDGMHVWDLLGAISQKLFELQAWFFYTIWHSMSSSKKVNHIHQRKLFFKKKKLKNWFFGWIFKKNREVWNFISRPWFEIFNFSLLHSLGNFMYFKKYRNEIFCQMNI